MDTITPTETNNALRATTLEFQELVQPVREKPINCSVCLDQMRLHACQTGGHWQLSARCTCSMHHINLPWPWRNKPTATQEELEALGFIVSL